MSKKTSTELATIPELSTETLNALILGGDLSRLKPEQKIEFYIGFCKRIGLDPATQPFKLIKLQGREVLYCDRGGCAQLNKLHNVSHKILSRETINDCHVVTVRAEINGTGRFTENSGAVPLKGLTAEAFCNALLKCETKAKRRATLDLIGLGLLDESDIETIPNLEQVDAEILEKEKARLAAQGLDPSLAEPFVPTKSVKPASAAPTKPVETVSEPEAPKTPEPEKPAATGSFRDHVISTIKVNEFKNRRVGDLELKDLKRLRSSWVEKYADKIKASDDKLKDATAILLALADKDEEERESVKELIARLQPEEK